jgi:hypothetical protein
LATTTSAKRESGAQVAEVDAADDRFGPREPRHHHPESIRVEVGAVDEPDAPLADEGRDAGDLQDRVRLQHRSLEGKDGGLVSERADLLEHRPRGLQARDHRLEARRVQPQPLHELPLRAADPEAVHQVQDGDVVDQHAGRLCIAAPVGESCA